MKQIHTKPSRIAERHYKNNTRSTLILLTRTSSEKALFVIHSVVKVIHFQKQENFLHKDMAETISNTRNTFTLIRYYTLRPYTGNYYLRHFMIKKEQNHFPINLFMILFLNISSHEHIFKNKPAREATMCPNII